LRDGRGWPAGSQPNDGRCRGQPQSHSENGYGEDNRLPISRRCRNGRVSGGHGFGGSCRDLYRCPAHGALTGGLRVEDVAFNTANKSRHLLDPSF
jgi:hypothetical protein